MADLHRTYGRFVADCIRFEDRLDELRLERPNLPTWRAQYLTEAGLSNLWQLWGRFCRDVLHASCAGCTTRTPGVAVTARAGDNTWQRIGYEARQAAQRRAVNPGQRIASLRQEPTWGDAVKMIDIITTLSPANRATLLTAFGLPVRGPKDLQTVRNACAHTHGENVADVRAIQIYYVAGVLRHPSDLAWRPDATSGTPAVLQWIDDMKVIAGIACG